jgi:O-antigen/teichoic acid export membrane protein
VLARSFTNIGVVYFRKELEFGRQFVWQFGGRVADFAVAVAAAVALRNVWALVLAFVAGDLVKLLLSYALHPHRPRLAIDRARTRELFGFGKWLVGLGILILLLTQVDNAVVGRLVGATALGFYQLARRMANVPATEIAHVIANVTFPAYSKIQDQVRKLREAYFMVLETTALAALPLAGGLLVLAPEVTLAFFGEKWLPSVDAIRILALWGVLVALASTTDAVFLAVGSPRTVSKYQAMQLLTLAALIYPLTLRWGIRGTSLAVTLAAIVPSWLALRRVARQIQGPSSDFARAIGLPLIGGCAAASPVLLIKRLGFSGHPWGLAFSLVTFGAVYVLVVRYLGGRFGYRFGPLVQEVVKALRR